MLQFRSRCRRVSVSLLFAAGVGMTVLAGCGGGGGVTSPADTGFPANIANYNPPSRWIELIEAAGLSEYATLGRQLEAAGKITVVGPAALDESYNAFSWIADRKIWINSPMFGRYPDVMDQAEIFLHELIHIQSGEMSHQGPWWSAQSQFRTWAQQQG